jgi:hypothetical protein
MNIWSVHSFIVSVVIIIFGYVFPILSSAKAILSRDEDALKEWLTYWAVFSIFIILEEFFDFLLWRLPFYGEVKIACIMWLSLPGFQGAYRVYNYLIQPYFEQYEEDIDEMIEEVSNKIQAKTKKHVQSILWQVLMSPSDGLLAEATRFFMFLKRFVNNEEEVKVNSEVKVMSAHLLKDFRAMMIEGMHLEVGSLKSEMKVSKLSLVEERGHFIDIDFVEQSDRVIHFAKVPLLGVVNVSQDSEDNSIVCIEHCSVGDLFIRTPDSIDADAMIAGLQVIQMSTRSMHARLLKKAFSVVIAHSNYEALSKSFILWRKMQKNNDII